MLLFSAATSSLPDLHWSYEREDAKANCHLKSFRIQAHLKFESELLLVYERLIESSF